LQLISCAKLSKNHNKMSLPNERLEKLSQFLNDNPKDSFVRFAMALEYIKLNDDATALTYFNLIKQDEPNYVGLYYHFGKLLERQEKYFEARDMYNIGQKVCAQANDQHALSEIKGALDLLENSIDFEDE